MQQPMTFKPNGIEDKLVTKNLGDEIFMNDWRLSVDMPFEEDAKKESINIEQYRCYYTITILH
jgi:hypothetical protein